MNYSKRYRKKIITIMMITMISLFLGMMIGILSGRVAKAINIKKNAEVYGVSDGRHSRELTWHEVGEADFVPLDVDMDEDLQRYVFDECKVYGIDFCFIMAVIEHESGFQPDIISNTGDYGLMQINEINHEWLSKELGIVDFLDPKKNIKAGVYVFRQLFEKYDDPEQVLMAYNFGEEGAKRLWDEGIYSSEYSEEIMDKQTEYVNEYEGKVTVDD